jgi:hypothetical protein
VISSRIDEEKEQRLYNRRIPEEGKSAKIVFA